MFLVQTSPGNFKLRSAEHSLQSTACRNVMRRWFRERLIYLCLKPVLCSVGGSAAKFYKIYYIYTKLIQDQYCPYLYQCVMIYETCQFANSEQILISTKSLWFLFSMIII